MKKTVAELERLNKEFLTVKEASDFLGVSTATFYRYAENFPFRIEQIGKRKLIPRRSLIEFVNRTK